LIISIDDFQDLNGIDSRLIKIKNDLKLSVFFRSDSVIYFKKNDEPLENVLYPDLIEKKILSALYGNDIDKIGILFNDFFEYWKGKTVIRHTVDEIFIRFAAFMINSLKSANPELCSRLDDLHIIENIIKCYTVFELREIFELILNLIENGLDKSQGLNSFPVKKALNYIHDCYMNDINLSDISAKLDINLTYLGKLFYKEVGKHYPQYLKEIRIKKAIELLLSNDYNFIEISKKTGFSNPKYFYRVFKEITGFSPGDYKKFMNS
jgi:two-component system, response regulator YesN